MRITILRTAFIIFLSVSISGWIKCQEISRPNLAMKSHETLEISSIEFRGGKTIVNMLIENRITGGSFCADRKISITEPSGRKISIIKAVNIPVCPATYNFRAIGEKLMFSLEFPPLNPGTDWIDIVEECSDNCFWFYGVTLDNQLNKRLNDAFAAASAGKPEDNIVLFRKILEDVDSKNPGIEGLLYINIINAAVEAGDNVETAVWYKRLLTSGAPRLNFYVKYLNDRGIKY
jgi:hypothetical protein